MFIWLFSRFNTFCACLWLGSCSLDSFAQEALCLTNHPGDDRHGIYAPNGSDIVFESNRDGNWEIYLMNKSGADIHRLTNHDSIERSPYFHPKEQKIIFESNRSGKFQLYEMDIHTSKIRKIEVPKCPGDLLFPTYAPTGKKIACVCQESTDKSNIIIINRKGKIIRQITSSPFRSFFPRWSIDGEKMVYFSRKDTENHHDEIYLYEFKNGNSKRLTRSSLHRFCPSFSPDGKKIAMVASLEHKRPEIIIMDISSGQTWQVTDNDTGDTLPVFHPNGHKLLITTFKDGNFELCEILLPSLPLRG